MDPWNDAGILEYNFLPMTNSSIVIPAGTQVNELYENYTSSYKQYCCITSYSDSK